MYILNKIIIIIINRLENLFNASKNDHLTHVDPKLYTKCPQEYKLMNDKYLSKKPIFCSWHLLHKQVKFGGLSDI
jgi:hypothetical protein